MSAVCVVAHFVPTHLGVSTCLLAYMFFAGMNWPMLESLCSETRDAHEMSRRVGAYNLTWAASGLLALWTAGELIEHWRSGMFVLPAMLHGSTVLIMLALTRDSIAPETNEVAHIEPEPELLRSRKLALWLSRIALPAMYVVNYALGAILPTLPIMRQFSPAMETMYGSVWVVARLILFATLGATAFWHTRPRLLLVSSIGLLVGFVIITLGTTLPALIGGQILLGIAMAFIYTGSLYFGMVLSQGSTEHSGYHEALIGLGGILGPGAGALTQHLWPGEVKMAIVAVSGIVALSVLCAAGASLRLRSNRVSV
jgi:MFS family permease